MGHPGRVESFATGRRSVCPDCGADFVEARADGVSILRCPWAAVPYQVEAAEVSCGRPYSRGTSDIVAQYARESFGKRA